ncbi:MAG: hypothetical protein H3C43_00085 [Leptonema sp. (in: Bacteria)]|nr:hypothetical protein [Leptonema sp. (in: bacteria)]
MKTLIFITLILTSTLISTLVSPIVSSPYSVVFKAGGETNKPPQVNQNQKTSTEISRRQIQVGIGFWNSNLDNAITDTENSTKFVYSLKSDLYYSIENSNIELISTNSFFAGLLYKSTSMLSIGYTPVMLDQNQVSSTELLRLSEFAGIHIHIGNKKFGWLRVSPLQLIDQPGRLVSTKKLDRSDLLDSNSTNLDSLYLDLKESFFFQSIQDSLSFRQFEGKIASNQFKDRITHQIRYELRIDWLQFGASYRTANFSRTAITPELILDHGEVDIGIISKIASVNFGATRSFGQVTQTNKKRMPINGLEYRSNIWAQFKDFEMNLFGSRSTSDQKSHLNHLEQIGFIDFGASLVDLPILGSYSTMLHSVPCIEDLCDDVFRSKTSQMFRYSSDYLELTLSYLFNWVGFAIRSGILLPYRFEKYDNLGQKTKEIYNDLTEVSLEVQAFPAELQNGIFSVSYSRLYRRNVETRQRELESQSVSFRIKVNLN